MTQNQLLHLTSLEKLATSMKQDEVDVFLCSQKLYSDPQNSQIPKEYSAHSTLLHPPPNLELVTF